MSIRNTLFAAASVLALGACGTHVDRSDWGAAGSPTYVAKHAAWDACVDSHVPVKTSSFKLIPKMNVIAGAAAIPVGAAIGSFGANAGLGAGVGAGLMAWSLLVQANLEQQGQCLRDHGIKVISVDGEFKSKI